MDFVSNKLKEEINGWEFLAMHPSARYALYVINL